MTTAHGQATRDRRGTTEGDGADAENLSRIEQVATRTGMTKRTLRYYEEMGLLDPPTRTEGGYRLYTEDDVRRLERIKRMKDLLGFKLEKIRELVRAEEEREHVADAYRRDTEPEARLARLDEAEALVRRQLQLVEEKLGGLQEMRDTLRARLDKYAALRADLRDQLARRG